MVRRRLDKKLLHYYESVRPKSGGLSIHEADSWNLFSHSFLHNIYHASLDEATLGTANMADCMCVPQSGHFGGPLAV